MELIDSYVFFEDLVLFAGMALKSKPVRLRSQDNCPPTTLSLDRDKIHQVILNLVLNAADAAGESGTILIKASLADDHYVLEICNSGEPIPGELKNRIFEPFFTTKEPGRGSGIGLAISRGIAESHQGTLDLFEPPEGFAVCFGMKLPLNEGAYEI
jgi:signal transduction histidine kinase